MPFGQPSVATLPASLDFAGQTILVTGANTGLGYATALTYLRRGASTMVLAVRSISKGETAKAELLSDPVVAARTEQPIIDIRELDMASEKSVVTFGEHMKTTYPALHTAILNAGVFTFKWDTTKETGRETTIQVNYMSTVLLGLLLLPQLKEKSKSSGSPTHLTFVGSERALVPRFKVPETESVLDSLANPKTYDGQLRYAESKLLLASFIKAFSATVDPAEVIVNNVCPGAVATNLARDAPWYLKPVVPLFHIVMGARTPEVGARLVVRAATAGKDTHGQLLAKNDQILQIPFIEGASGSKFNERVRDETLKAFEQGCFTGIQQ